MSFRLRVRLAPIALALVLRTPEACAMDCADCDGDGRVSINELVTGVSIALGEAQLSVCPALDRNGDGGVTIDELVAAISQALNGCPPTPGPSPSNTLPAADTPTPTPTQRTGSQLPPTDSATLLVWLQAGSYLDWHAESAPHPSAGPHFGVVRAFVNDALFASLSGTAVQHPAGAAAVKELYGAAGSTVRGWAVMVKIQDDSDRGRGWYWYEVFGSSGGGSIGNPVCTGCHMLGRDFIRIPFPLQ